MRYRGLWWTAAAVAVGGLLLVGLTGQIAADLMGDIQQGLQSTGKLFGINTIADVADLVAKGFANRRGGSPEPAAAGTESGADSFMASSSSSRVPSMMVMMMKLLGLDGNQLGAMLVNSIVFLAHIIGTNLGAFRKPSLDSGDSSTARPTDYGRPSEDSTPPPPPQTGDSSKPPAAGANPLDWFLRNPPRQFRALLEQVQHSDLTEHLDRELRQLDHYPAEDTDCMRLLMCKIKPFIWKMQHVVRDQILVRSKAGGTAGQSQPQATPQRPAPQPPPSGEEIMKGIHDNLPSAEEFQRQSEACERQFRHCTRQDAFRVA